MQSLRETIRNLILEVDLGQQVWANIAPPKSRHKGTEPNTTIEQRMFDAMLAWLNEEDASLMTPDVINAILEAEEDKRYDDVFSTSMRGIRKNALYRGQVTSRVDLEAILGISREDTLEYALNDEWIPVEFYFNNAQWHRGTNTVSSWTIDQSVAERFSHDNKRKIQDPVSIILEVNPKDPENIEHTFLNCMHLYGFGALGKHQYEKEMLAIKPPKVSRVKITKWNIFGDVSTPGGWADKHPDFKPIKDEYFRLEQEKLKLDLESEDYLPF